MRIAPIAMVLVVLAVGAPGSVSAGQQAPPAAPPAGQPAASPAGQPPAPGAPAAPTVAAQPRTFTAPAGLLFNTVRADRAEDFEKAMGSLQAALAKSTDEKVRAQAKGWRVFKAAEAGPSGTVLYVFVIDPTVPGADYGLGRILGAAYPDQAQLREIWKLYTGALTGSSLLNLTPVQPPAPSQLPAQ
jgi:hypothetical protein